MPPTSYIGLENHCVTGRGMPFITRYRNTNTVFIRGGVPARSGASEVFVTVENPIHYFAAVIDYSGSRLYLLEFAEDARERRSRHPRRQPVQARPLPWTPWRRRSPSARRALLWRTQARSR